MGQSIKGEQKMSMSMLMNSALLIELAEQFDILSQVLREKYNLEDYHSRTGRTELGRYQELSELLLKKGIDVSYGSSGGRNMSLNNVIITFTRTGTKLTYSVKE